MGTITQAPPTKWDPPYVHERGWIYQHILLASGGVVRLGAKEVRREHTGIHGVVDFSYRQLGGTWLTLAYSTFNVGRDDDRTRLCNSAVKLLAKAAADPDKAEMTAENMKHALDLFCKELWDEVVKSTEGELMSGDDTTQVKQLVKGLVVDGGGTILFAPPGRNKTTTMLLMAVCLDAGISLPGIFEIEAPQPGLFINLERSRQSLAYRLARTNRCLGLAPERQMAFMNARGRNLSDVYEAAARTMEKYGLKVCYLDSLSRAGSGSLSDDEVANKTMDRLNALAPTWVLAAHTPRADATHVFGSQMFDAAEDVGVQLISQPGLEVSGLGLEVMKANDIPTGWHCTLAFEWGDKGLNRVRLARSGEFSDIESGRKRALLELVMELLLLRGQMTATKIAVELGVNRANLSHKMRHSELFVEVGRVGPEVFYGVRTQGELGV